ncbi:MAG: hemolysin family protein [Simkaniaceae bacterium]|nr:hemolysin family protein [Simkaniaceae bacterium]
MTTILLSILLVIFILVSGFLSATETSMFSLPYFQIKAFARDKDIKRRLVSMILSQPRKLLVTILMLNITMNILVQNTVSSLFEEFPGWTISVVLPLILTLIFGELIPKAIAISNNIKVATAVAPPIYFLQWVLRPLRDGITWFTDHLSSFFFFFLKKEKEISVNEIKHALKTSRDFGVLSLEEAKLMRGYLSLEEMIVKEIMSPRGDMIYYDISDPLEELLTLFIEKECTRIPVCENDRENILGVIDSEHMFLHQSEIKTPEDLKLFLRKPYYVPESMPAKLLFNQFNLKNWQFAIVVDEYGSVTGLITKEDLIEIVVGQIDNKRDTSRLYTRSGSDVMIASGKLELAEFEEIFDTQLVSECNMATLGGWLTEKMGDIPHTGAKFVTDRFLFHVLSSTPSYVESVYVRRLHKRSIRKERAV